jgi:hypothetical protein
MIILAPAVPLYSYTYLSRNFDPGKSVWISTFFVVVMAIALYARLKKGKTTDLKDLNGVMKEISEGNFTISTDVLEIAKTSLCLMR